MRERPPTPINGRARRIAAGVALVVLALVVGACGLVPVVGPRSWAFGATSQAGAASDIKVTDATGRITNVELDPADANLFGGVAVPAAHPGALDVPWTGGPCDVTTTIDIAAQGAGLDVHVAIVAGDQPCDAMGVPHAIRLTLGQAVAPGMVTVRQ